MGISRVLIIALTVALAACSNEDGIRVLTHDGDGPDEFRILPSKPLTAPKDYASLPEPTPGGSNLTDQDPRGDAVAALGGKRSAVSANTVSRSDSGLLNYAARKGRSAAIRQTLAEEDEAFRARRGRFSNIKIVQNDRYNDVYKPYHLDQYFEYRRWLKAGVSTPAAPPK